MATEQEPLPFPKTQEHVEASLQKGCDALNVDDLINVVDSLSRALKIKFIMWKTPVASTTIVTIMLNQFSLYQIYKLFLHWKLLFSWVTSPLDQDNGMLLPT